VSYMKYGVFHVGPEGVATCVEHFDTEEEAEQHADWLNDIRDAAQRLDGTIFEVRSHD